MNNLHTMVLNRRHELIDLFETYAGEVRFGKAYIEPNLQQLEARSSILEIGAGSLILATQLVRESFKVTALEPTGEGFSHFYQLRALVIGVAKANELVAELLIIPSHALAIQERFSFAFSINVMEYVGDVGAVIHRVCESLKSASFYRFTCQNYLFPYEPHFNMSTLISKPLTERVFKIFFYSSKAVNNPSVVWNSLNWIAVSKVRSIVRSCNFSSVAFDRKMLSKILARALTDSEFASRRSPVIVVLISIMVRLRLHKFLNLIPAVVQPVMNCTLSKGP